MHEIKVVATRSDKWWIAEFTIDGREYGTQAKRLDLLTPMVIDAAALMTGKPAEEFTVSMEFKNCEGLETVRDYKDAAIVAKDATARASELSRKAVRELSQAGLTMRDIGTVMGISVQRVSQLASR